MTALLDFKEKATSFTTGDLGAGGGVGVIGVSTFGAGVLTGGVRSGVFASGRLAGGVSDSDFCFVVLFFATTGVFFTAGLAAGGTMVCGAVGGFSIAGMVSVSIGVITISDGAILVSASTVFSSVAGALSLADPLHLTSKIAEKMNKTPAKAYRRECFFMARFCF